MDYLFFIGMGLLAGLLAGLFGVGGGLIVVPGLVILFSHLNVSPDFTMHLAAGTSFAVMIMTSSSSAYSHYRLGTIRMPLVRSMVPGIAMGVIVGSVIAHFLHTNVLQTILGCFLLCVTVSMIYSSIYSYESDGCVPGAPVLMSVSSVIGCFSGLIGIGSGSMAVPFLSRFGVPMKNVAGVSSACTFVTAIIGTLSFIITGWGTSEHLLYVTGYIYWPAFLFISIGSVLTAPLGAMLSRRWPSHFSKRIFAVLLLTLAFHMLF